MKSLYDFTATEIKKILTEKNIAHEYVIGEFDFIWIGVRVKTKYYWIQFFDETSMVNKMVTYSQITGKESNAYNERCKVQTRFEKIINN